MEFTFRFFFLVFIKIIYPYNTNNFDAYYYSIRWKTAIPPCTPITRLSPSLTSTSILLYDNYSKNPTCFPSTDSTISSNFIIFKCIKDSICLGTISSLIHKLSTSSMNMFGYIFRMHRKSSYAGQTSTTH